MKKLFACFFMFAISATVGAADDTVIVSRVIPSVSQNSGGSAPVATPTVASRVAVTRAVVPAPAPTATADSATDTGAVSAARGQAVATTGATGRSAVVSRTLNLNTGQTGEGRSAGTVARAQAARAPDGQRDTLESAVRTVGRNARTESASINNNPSVRRAGLVLRPSTAEVGGRARIDGTDIQTGTNIGNDRPRGVQTRAAAQTAETIAEATTRLQQTADLNKSCQQQYNDCMDQFCAVIDANQKRCSCSANLSQYSKVEEAVKSANVQLNDVAQRIRYVGLSADEIRAIMSATEAELELSGRRDTTESRNMLEAIEKLIKNPTGIGGYSGDTYTGMDMELDFSGDPANLFSLDFLGTNTSSFSNLRGRELYNAATKRCNSVLTQCKGAGATLQQITGNYDLAIDKDCIAYEQGLSKMNDSLRNNVRSANNMLQKARLAVLQNKNQYDAKGCISALNTCMVDEMVCGADYTKCLDPTKRYIDENGQVVLGQRISDITAFMEKFSNSDIDQDFLTKARTTSLDPNDCAKSNKDGRCIVRYLLEKIGTGKNVNEGGLCRAVLDKCQRVTYDQNGRYLPYNDVVVNYIQRAMINIYSAQHKIISDYASSCMLDIAQCYSQQFSQISSWSSAAGVDSIYKVMNGSCRNIALTCAYAVFANDTTSCDTDSNKCIENISKMFHQSLLCPENSVFTATPGVPGNKYTNAGDLNDGKMYVNEHCLCNNNYKNWGKLCVVGICNAGTYRNPNTGQCDICPRDNYCEANNNADPVKKTCIGAPPGSATCQTTP